MRWAVTAVGQLLSCCGCWVAGQKRFAMGGTELLRLLGGLANDYQANQQPSDSGTKRLRNQATQEPSNSGTKQLSNSATERALTPSRRHGFGSRRSGRERRKASARRRQHRACGGPRRTAARR